MAQLTGNEINALADRYWSGASNKHWKGKAFNDELASLGLDYPINQVKTHADLESHIFEIITPRVKGKSHFEPQELLLVCSWKSDRTLPCVAINERAQGTIRKVSSAALGVNLTAKQRRDALRQLHGVGVRLASALLTVSDPTEFTVLDWRALHTLTDRRESAGSHGFWTHKNGWWDAHYDAYRSGCKDIANREGVSLRDLDRALWRWSFEKS